MTRNEISLLLVKACAAYPNKAPDFKKRPEIFEVWVEFLTPVDGERALQNLSLHIETSEFFPTIADIIRRDREFISEHAQLRLQTADTFAQLDRWAAASNTPPPPGYWETGRAMLRAAGAGRSDEEVGDDGQD